MNRRRYLRALAGALLLLATPALAQDYPNRSINWVIPYPPGGTTDIMARLTAAKVSEILKTPIIPVNKAGASGTVGSDSVRTSPADGYTILFNASLFVLGKQLYKTLPYDPQTDFLPLGRVAAAPLMLITHPSVKANTLTELVAAAKADPKSYNFAVSSLGAAGHLATLEFLRLAKLDLTLVPYKGTAPAVSDIMAGTVQLFIDPIAATYPPVKGGKAKALAITSTKRAATAPDVPTSAEAGMPDLVLASWYGAWAPKGTPQAVVDRLAKALEQAANDLEFKARLEQLGLEPVFDGPAAFRKYIAADVEKNAALLKGANYQPE
ncbi:MAG: tripartite tricarboxylate transporter substrate binding protein [Alphaproteobacteria bacterium]|nr:tripartite tricarboxylate transporter substrate binding protein [Alphaproteobacteria bacterium]